jgi:hypothetical protein
VLPPIFTVAIMLNQHLCQETSIIASPTFSLSLSHTHTYTQFRSIFEKGFTRLTCNMPFYHRLEIFLSNWSKFNTKHAFLRYFKVIMWL